MTATETIPGPIAPTAPPRNPRYPACMSGDASDEWWAANNRHAGLTKLAGPCRDCIAGSIYQREAVEAGVCDGVPSGQRADDDDEAWPSLPRAARRSTRRRARRITKATLG